VTPNTPIASSSGWLDEALRVVRAGGVVALPFERLFGLAADAFNPVAVARIDEIKRRSSWSQPVAVIIPDWEGLSRVAIDFPPLAVELAEAHWPGPLTLIVPGGDDLPEQLRSESGLIGVRLAGPCSAAELAREGDLVLTATSANLTGGPDALRHEDVQQLEGVDLIVPGRVPGPPGSTVVDATGTRPEVVRAGVIDFGEGAP
jgi:L-threonylcarbamoyladenylate synthase